MPLVHEHLPQAGHVHSVWAFILHGVYSSGRPLHGMHTRHFSASLQQQKTIKNYNSKFYNKQTKTNTNIERTKKKTTVNFKQKIRFLGVVQQCGPTVKVSYYPNDLLDQLTSKYVFRKQALSSLKMMDPALSHKP